MLPLLQVGDDLMLLYVISEEVLDHRTSLEINRFQYCQDNLDISLEYGPVIKKINKYFLFCFLAQAHD